MPKYNVKGGTLTCGCGLRYHVSLFRDVLRVIASHAYRSGQEYPGDPITEAVEAGYDYGRREEGEANVTGQPPALTTDTRSARTSSDARMRHDYPKLMEFFSRHAVGPLAAPSCFLCGQKTLPKEAGMTDRVIAIQHEELPGIVICTGCRDAALTPNREDQDA